MTDITTMQGGKMPEPLHNALVCLQGEGYIDTAKELESWAYELTAQLAAVRSQTFEEAVKEFSLREFHGHMYQTRSKSEVEDAIRRKAKAAREHRD